MLLGSLPALMLIFGVGNPNARCNMPSCLQSSVRINYVPRSIISNLAVQNSILAKSNLQDGIAT